MVKYCLINILELNVKYNSSGVLQIIWGEWLNKSTTIAHLSSDSYTSVVLDVVIYKYLISTESNKNWIWILDVYRFILRSKGKCFGLRVKVLITICSS